MILELPADVQMAIRLRAVKERITTGQVVAVAIMRTFPQDLAEAEREKPKKGKVRR